MSLGRKTHVKIVSNGSRAMDYDVEMDPEKPKKVSIRKPKKVSIRKPKKVSIRKPKKIGIRKPKKIGIRKPKKVGIHKPKKVGTRKPKKVGIRKRKIVCSGGRLKTIPLRMTVDPSTNMADDHQKASIKELSFKKKLAMILKQNGLILATFVGIVVGFGLGMGLREVRMSDHALMWLGLPGELFLRCLKATIVPLVITMVITCTATLDPKSNGKIAVVAILGFFLTQVVACIIAIVMFFVFKPDRAINEENGEKFGTNLETQDVFADLFR
ncbi:Excitatory amino acid transporter 1 [Bulinus truncatus]|nr:Excitatory amino acid transporter 1 [Bulinus truncatus]